MKITIEAKNLLFNRKEKYYIICNKEMIGTIYSGERKVFDIDMEVIKLYVVMITRKYFIVSDMIDIKDKEKCILDLYIKNQRCYLKINDRQL